MKLSRYLVGALVVLGTVNFSACVSPDVQDAGKAVVAKTVAAVGDKAAAEAAIKTAKAENKASGELSFEWRDNGKMLKKADEALAKGDYAAAIKTANKITKMAKAAQQQAADQKSAGPRF